MEATEEQTAHERHFIRRARERLKVSLSAKKYARILEILHRGEEGVRFVGAGTTPDRTLWHIRAFGVAMVVVYDCRTDRVVTCVASHEWRRGPREKPSWQKQIEADRKAKLRRLRARR